MRGFGVNHFGGVFDARLVRIYQIIGSSPEILGSRGVGRAAVSVGLWSFDAEAQARLAPRSEISAAQSRRWFDVSFGPMEQFQCAING